MKTKRWMLLLLCLLLVTFLIAAPASAEENSGQCGDNLYWSFNSNTGKLTITGSGEMDSAPWLEHVGYNCLDRIKSVSLPTGLTSISDGAFHGCTGLTSITIPNGVTSIGNNAFYGCTGLTSVTIPNRVTSIGDGAFEKCTGLTSVTIPDSVTTIYGTSFFGCTGLTSICVGSGNKYFCSIDGVLFSADKSLLVDYPDGRKGNYSIPNGVDDFCRGAFSGCTGLTGITIPSSFHWISDYAFSGCTGLTSVTIPSSVFSIRCCAFLNCTGLTSVIIPTHVDRIEESAFAGCTGLTSVTIPNSVTSIGDGAFEQCTGLTSITIPSSVKSIGGMAFKGCTSLGSFNVNQDNQNYCSVGGVLFSKDKKTLNILPGGKKGSYSIPNGVNSIGDYAFAGCSGLTSVTIPSSITSISDHAFAGCTGLTSVTIPNSVSRIDYYAFEDCTGLTSIAISSSVTSISASAFRGCTGLTSVTIPNSVTSIGASAFWGCTGLTSVYIPKSITNIEEYAFAGCTGLKTVKYQGTQTQKEKIYIADGNEKLLKASWNYSTVAKPTINTQPKSMTAVVNTPAQFTVVASGIDLQYQWQWSADSGKTWNNSSSATTGYNTATLQVTATAARNSYKYRCKVSNSAGTTTSNAATLYVKPGITSQPTDKTVSVGSTATFKVVASNATGYQWQWSADNGSTWNNSSSATTGYNTATLQVTATAARNGYKYRCKVSNSVGTTTSNAATLYVKPGITSQPTDKTVSVGFTATFKVVASNATGYQWQWSADNGSTWNNSSSATTGYNTATLQVTATAARNGYKYRCKVSNSVGTTTSNAATLTVDLRPTITSQPSNKTVSAGSTVTFLVVTYYATSYQWQWSADSGKTWNNSSSSTTGYYYTATPQRTTLEVTATAARNGYKYRCKVSNSAGTVTSNAATLTVDLRPTITTQPTDSFVVFGSTATFKVVASNATGYQWQWSADNGATWKDSSSATTGYNTATLQVTATAARNGYRYRCKVSNSAGTVTSNAATLVADFQ